MKVLDVPSSGSVNWRTASRNRNGQYIRNRSIPVQPRSTAQLAIRGFLVLAAQSWKSLSQGDQMAWKTFGSLHPRTDSLGQSNPPTGEQAFIGVCVTSQLLGDGLIAGAPPIEPVMSAFTEGLLSSIDSVTLITGQVCPTGGRIMVWAARPASTGKHFYGAPTYLQASTVDQTSPIDISAALTARWGTPPDGSVIQITQVPVVNGITGSRQTSQIVYNGGSQLTAPTDPANFTVSAATESILYSIVNATLPIGVQYFEFHYRPTGDPAWTQTTPVRFVSQDDAMTGIVADGLAATQFDVQLRWYSGTVVGLPSAWSSTQTVTPT